MKFQKIYIIYFEFDFLVVHILNVENKKQK